MGGTTSLFKNLQGRFWGKKEVRILICGLDAAGKTTMLYRLKLGEVVTTIPTIGFNVETVEHKNISFTAWDVGGRDKMRPLLRHYYKGTDALIFVIDSNDKDRIDEIKEEIQRALSEDELRDAVVLVMANKQDLEHSMMVAEVTEKLGLHQLRNKWYIVGCSALNGEGLYEGLDWLAGELGNQATKKAISSAVQTSIDDAAKTVGGKEVKSGRSLLWEPILSIKKWLFPHN